MSKLFKISTIAVTALIAVAALGIGGAHAGYFDAFGIYHPTCVWTIFGPSAADLQRGRHRIAWCRPSCLIAY